MKLNVTNWDESEWEQPIKHGVARGKLLRCVSRAAAPKKDIDRLRKLSKKPFRCVA